LNNGIRVREVTFKNWLVVSIMTIDLKPIQGTNKPKSALLIPFISKSNFPSSIEFLSTGLDMIFTYKYAECMVMIYDKFKYEFD
jgi:hypothetical protein